MKALLCASANRLVRSSGEPVEVRGARRSGLRPVRK
jgi:hypothetical protein